MGSDTTHDPTLTEADCGAAPRDLTARQPSEPLPLPARYVDLGALAHGGTGVIHRVEDRELHRIVAVKVQHPRLALHLRARSRFDAEAVMTARLQHPGIVAIHDRGELQDGRLWFAMKEVRGQTLDRVVAELHDTPAGAGTSTRHRMLESFYSVCQTMAYAHAQGVIHRDLKPLNLMIGEFGEVLVMDWGLARVLGQPEPRGPAYEDHPTAGMTRDGDVLGTRGYMAPEQARGEPVGAGADVYALGAVLWHILTGARPPDPGTPIVWPSSTPEALHDVGDRALAPLPEERFADAGLMAAALRRWLDGEARRRRAWDAIAKADALGPAIVKIRRRAVELRQRAATMLQGCQPHDPVALKEPGWALEDGAADLERQTTMQQTRQVQHLHAALNAVPDLVEAHERLADTYRDQLQQAEDRGDTPGVVRYETLLEAHDRGRHAAFLRGEGDLTLLTDPPASQCLLYRVDEVKRRLHEVYVRDLGAAPLHNVTLPRGSYIVKLNTPGCATVRYPVHIDRGVPWDNVAPGDSNSGVVPLPAASALGPDDIYVPPGWFWSGDLGAIDGLPRRRFWVDGFVMRRHPVTNREMLAFLNDLVNQGRSAEAEALAPRERATAPGEPEARAIYGQGEDRWFSLRPDESGVLWGPEWPVALVSWQAARAYAVWEAERSGKPWRLPHDLEWEKAARGVDGRRLPWGDFFDPTWACTAQSGAGPPTRAPVGQHPVDTSPYGVQGLAGNVRDWCANTYQRSGLPPDAQRVVSDDEGEGEYRLVRGGAWSGMGNVCFAGGRMVGRPAKRLAAVGFRLVRSTQV